MRSRVERESRGKRIEARRGERRAREERESRGKRAGTDKEGSDTGRARRGERREREREQSDEGPH